ncbi:adhesion G protein-coupled receptor E3-like [Patiria miniata]|uniref:G-protein coupled receptors family 2 profile 2 domain-containing protein n=1 Tax=Patiria miniata TaxID=46514 RepID=A0A914ARR3_PATMI|nr:adhesion G protein-coupled receptor E3-like [Patiria miniata]
MTVYLLVLLAVFGGAMADTNNTKPQAMVVLPLTASTGRFNKVYAAIDVTVYEANIPNVWAPTKELVLVVMNVTDAPSEETAIILDGDSDEPTRFGSRVIGLEVITASGGKISADFDETPIEVTFPRLEFLSEENIVCANQPADKMKWYTKGCRVSSVTNDDVTCSCGFLANYALLLQPNKEANTPGMDLLTPFGLVLSFATLCVVLLAYRFSRSTSCRTVTHASLSLAMVALYSTVFFRDDENPVISTTVAILFHFFLQATFIWMALAGALFYLTSHDEHTSTSRIRPRALLLIGWGCAAVGAVASVAVGLCGCATSTGSCWLSSDDVFVWQLMGPIVYMFAIKALITCRLTGGMGWKERKLNSQETVQIRSGLRMVVVLEPFVCLLWILGLSYSTDGNIFLAHAFVTLNSLQGLFVFCTSCLMEDDVSEELNATRDSSTESIEK